MRDLAGQFGCGLGLVCAVLERPRSWVYYRRQVTNGRALRRPELEGPVRESVQGRPATYGYRRVHALLREQGIMCNPKTVWAVLRRHRWLSTARQQTRRPAPRWPRGRGGTESAVGVRFHLDSGLEWGEGAVGRDH